MSGRILVVEDDFITAQDLEMSLQELGFEVCGIAASGVEAVRAATAHHPDLVLMDIVLQGRKDGILAAREIRRSLTIPVLFLTAYADDGTVELAKCAEPAGYLVKPYHPRELNASIHVALHRARAQEPRPETSQDPAAMGTYQPAAVSDVPLTICAWCKRIRLTPTEWVACESFLRDVLGLVCSHGMCPTCFSETMPDSSE